MSMKLNSSMSVGEIAARWPRTIRVLQSLGVDYCCGGSRSIAEAADRLGIDVGPLIDQLEHAVGTAFDEDSRDWTAASMTELADHIERTHHAFVRESLEQIASMLQRVVQAHGDRMQFLPELARVLKSFADDMHDHMIREERVLFPWLRRLERSTEIQGGPPWSVKRPIDCMIHDHDDAGAALRSMRSLTNGFIAPEGSCGTVRALFRLIEEVECDTHLHIHKENNILFPAGILAEAQREPKRCSPSASMGPAL